ncbi:MAG: hypothetical protein V5A60_17825 [Haloarculaceae archaeon]
MSLRRALRLLTGRYRGEPFVAVVGLAVGLVLGAGYAVLFVVDAPWADAATYALFVLLVAPLFGAALWPYVAGEPPGSVRTLVRGTVDRYPRLLAARLAYVLLLVASAAALVSLVGALATLVSAANYATGGGATSLPPERATELAVLAVLLLGFVGVTTARMLFGFLDAAVLRRGRLRGSLDAGLSTALGAPFRVGAAAIALAPYRVVLPLLALAVVGQGAEIDGPLDVPFATPRLATLPADAPAYASPPDPAVAPALLVGLVVVDVVLTALVWPVAYGYHLTLFETLPAGDGNRRPVEAGDTTADGAGQ